MDDLTEDDGRSPVEILADTFLERRSAGENVTIDDYVRTYPDLADDIREVFPALEAMQSLSTEWKKKVVDPHQDGLPLPFQLGDFRLEREIGRGGMGIVYEAEHTSLQRRVAVKILRTSALTSRGEVDRFHKEARAAARLHHTNIVPVFDFGEAEGFHYIAMQLIQGEGLDAVVDRLRRHREDTLPPSEVHDGEPVDASGMKPDYGSGDYWQTVASIGIQAAHALSFAHSRGTIHRDIKPGNLLLDENGVIWVADFGLARQNDAGQPTQSGVLSGTLRYLAPENFQGRCDERTDQYGLGLSLYELSTLQPVVSAGGSHAEIMQQICEAKIVPPRQRTATVPRDLETILLKCLSAKPDDRYATCREVAEDLQRFVDGYPIRARRVSRRERIWRWAKRHPALAATSSMSAALLLLVAIVATLGYQAEYRQRQRAELTSEYAQQALDTVFDRYALATPSELVTETAVPTPVLTQEAAQMLERLLPIFDRLAQLDDQSTDVLLRAVVARRRVGEIQQRLGELDEAIASYRQAAAGFRLASGLTAAARAMHMAEIHNNIGACERMLGRIDEARTSHEAALQQLQPFADSPDADLTWQLARTHFLLARRLRPGESPYETTPDQPPHRPSAGLRPPPQPPQARSGITEDVRRHLKTAIALLESSEVEPLDARRRHLLAMCLRAQAPDQLARRTADEQASEDRALDILHQLVVEFPEAAEYRQSWVSVLSSFDTQHPDSISADGLPAAESRLRQAITEGRRLVAMHPYVPEYTLTLIHAYNRLAHLQEWRAEWAQEQQAARFLNGALEAYQSAATLQSGLAERFPESDTYRQWRDRFEDSAMRILNRPGRR